MAVSVAVMRCVCERISASRGGELPLAVCVGPRWLLRTVPLRCLRISRQSKLLVVELAVLGPGTIVGDTDVVDESSTRSMSVQATETVEVPSTRVLPLCLADVRRCHA